MIGTPPPIPPWVEQATQLDRQIGALSAKLERELAEIATVHHWLAIILILETVVVLAMGATLLWHLGTT